MRVWVGIEHFENFDFAFDFLVHLQSSDSFLVKDFDRDSDACLVMCAY